VAKPSAAITTSIKLSDYKLQVPQELKKKGWKSREERKRIREGIRLLCGISVC
jgi:hypothetical protein